MNIEKELKSKTLAERKLTVNGLNNARDLGGLKVSPQNLTNFQVVVRGESPQLITQEGKSAFDNYNITDVVDLRSNIESKSLGYGFAGDLKIHNAPMVKDSSFIANEGVKRGRKHEYLNYLNEGKNSFKVLIDAINQSVGAVYLHCAVGKDRTGVVTSMLLLALGVSEDDIVRDYLYSKQSVRRILPALANNSVYDDFAKPNWEYQTPKADDIAFVMDSIGGKAGAMAFLSSCNISERKLNTFQHKFLS